MFVKKGAVFLASVSLTNLERVYTEEVHVKAKLRLQCAVLRKRGKNQPFISEVTGLSVSTVSDILRRFETRGVAGCYAIKQKGQTPKLKPVQKLQLKKALSKSPEKQGLPFVIWTTKLVQYFIAKKFNATYALRYVRDFLSSLHLSIQTPRPEHIKANKKLQAQFKKNFDDKLRNLCEQDMRSSFWTKASSP
jgi:transposase